MSAFWDTSALVRVCVRGQISQRAKGILRQTGIVTWWATAVEVRGAVARLRRSGDLTDAAFLASSQRLASLLSVSGEILPVEQVREIALEQVERFPLRAADALQLAAALVWCRKKPRGRLFVCNDRQLSAAAAESGFQVESV